MRLAQHQNLRLFRNKKERGMICRGRKFDWSNSRIHDTGKRGMICRGRKFDWPSSRIYDKTMPRTSVRPSSCTSSSDMSSPWPLVAPTVAGSHPSTSSLTNTSCPDSSDILSSPTNQSNQTKALEPPSPLKESCSSRSSRAVPVPLKVAAAAGCLLSRPCASSGTAALRQRVSLQQQQQRDTPRTRTHTGPKAPIQSTGPPAGPFFRNSSRREEGRAGCVKEKHANG